MTSAVVRSLAALLCLLFLEMPAAMMTPDPVTPGGKFKAAVYEQVVPEVSFVQRALAVFSRRKALEEMGANLEVYRQQARLAAQREANIIVFPEVGIYGLNHFRLTIGNFLQYVPDPAQITWSPCDQPGRFAKTEVLRDLSCMAKLNSIYVVANVAERDACDRSGDANCPLEGRYNYNTAVAFDPEGRLVARYRKVNLFYEPAFNKATPESIFFDTPFGRVGLFICYDILYHRPAVSMVTDDNVTVVAFPTAWFDHAPLFTALGFHSSWARGQGVHLLAANIHRPAEGNHGSGLYTPRGAAHFYMAGGGDRLVVGELDVLTHRQPQTEGQGQIGVTHTGLPTDDEWLGELGGDWFRWRELRGGAGSLTVRQGNVTCRLTFDRQAGSSSELFALGVLDARHKLNSDFYFQVCTLVKCPDAGDRTTCGGVAGASLTRFSRLELWVNASAEFVYPQLITQGSGTTALAAPDAWHFHAGPRPLARGLTVTPSLDAPVVSASLVGVDYTREQTKTPTGGSLSSILGVIRSWF